jgi:hypothetical protein
VHIADRTRLRAGDRVELLFLFRGSDQHGTFIQSERLPVIVREASSGSYVGARLCALEFSIASRRRLSFVRATTYLAHSLHALSVYHQP